MHLFGQRIGMLISRMRAFGILREFFFVLLFSVSLICELGVKAWSKEGHAMMRMIAQLVPLKCFYLIMLLAIYPSQTLVQVLLDFAISVIKAGCCDWMIALILKELKTFALLAVGAIRNFTNQPFHYHH